MVFGLTVTVDLILLVSLLAPPDPVSSLRQAFTLCVCHYEEQHQICCVGEQDVIPRAELK